MKLCGVCVLVPLAILASPGGAAPGGVVYESRERPDLLDASSPQGLRVVQITNGGESGSWNVYTEAHVFTPDSRRFIFERNGAWGHGPYWLCDVKDRFALRPLIQEEGATAPSVSPDGKWVYYIVIASAHGLWGYNEYDAPPPSPGAPALKLMRVSLGDYKSETVLVIDDKVPGTSYRPSRIYEFSSISSDGRKLCVVCFLGDGKTPNAPFGLLVFDLRNRTSSVIALGPDFGNSHPQYSRSEDPRFSRDILVQHDNGSTYDPSGKHLTRATEPGIDLHVIRDDGQNWRDIPIGRDGVEHVQGHQQFRGRMNTVLSSMSMKGKNRILEAFPIPTDDKTSHTGFKIPGGKYVDITRNLEHAAFVHFSPDLTGMHIVSDTRGVDAKTERATAGLVIGTLSEGPNPELTVLPLLDTHSSFGNTQPSHPHPFFSPDGSMVFFNSDESGRPQVYMVTGYKFPAAR